MNVTLSAALLTGIITVILLATKRVGAASALFVWLSGFTVASTGFAGIVNQFLTAVAGILHH